MFVHLLAFCACSFATHATTPGVSINCSHLRFICCGCIMPPHCSSYHNCPTRKRMRITNTLSSAEVGQSLTAFLTHQDISGIMLQVIDEMNSLRQPVITNRQNNVTSVESTRDNSSQQAPSVTTTITMELTALSYCYNCVL